MQLSFFLPGMPNGHFKAVGPFFLFYSVEKYPVVLRKQ